MTWQGWLQIALFAALVTAVVRPFGGYIAANVNGGGYVLRVFAPFERLLYWLGGIDPEKEQSWTEYALALLWFHVVYKNGDKIKTLYVLSPNYQAGKDVVAGMTSTYKGKVVGQSLYKVGESDFQAYISKLRAEKPEAVPYSRSGDRKTKPIPRVRSKPREEVMIAGPILPFVPRGLFLGSDQSVIARWHVAFLSDGCESMGLAS